MLKRPSRPSPALVISIVALVFAMTGTGIAAKSVIDGKNIKKGSITADKLADGAITPKKLNSSVIPKGYAFLVAKPPTGKAARARAASTAHASGGTAPAYITPVLCADGSVVFPPARCPAPAPATSVPVPGPKGDTGTNGTNGADAGVAGTMRATIPGKLDNPFGVLGVYLGSPLGLGTVFDAASGVETAFNAAASVAPSGAATQISDVYFEVLPNSSGKMPKGGAAIMYVDGQSTESQNTAKCDIEDLSVTTHCSFKGPVTIPAGAKFAWDFAFFGPTGKGWDAFDISAAYRSTVAP